MVSSTLAVSVVTGKWEAASTALGAVVVGACEGGWGRWIARAACRSLHWALGAAVLQAITGPSVRENCC